MLPGPTNQYVSALPLNPYDVSIHLIYIVRLVVPVVKTIHSLILYRDVVIQLILTTAVQVQHFEHPESCCVVGASPVVYMHCPASAPQQD